MDLNKSALFLEKEGFDTSVNDGVLAANKSAGEKSVEITLDSGGGCLVKKTVLLPGETKKIAVMGKTVYEITQNQKVSQIRIKLQSPADLEKLLEYIKG